MSENQIWKTPKLDAAYIILIIIIIIIIIIRLLFFIHGALRTEVTNAPKSQANNWVFSRLLNSRIVMSDCRNEAGILFQSLSPATWKACLRNPPECEGPHRWRHQMNVVVECECLTVSRRIDAHSLAVLFAVEPMSVNVASAVPRARTAPGRRVEQPLDVVFTAHARLLWHRAHC